MIFLNDREEILENEDLENDQEISEEPSNESAFESGSEQEIEEQPIEMVSPGKGIGIADLKALKKLFSLKTKIVIGVFVLALIALLFFSILMSDELKVKYEYLPPKCTEVNIHFEHRENEDLNLKLEEYVKSMVYSLTKDMNHPERVLYQAIAVIVRTNAQSLNNCTLNITDEVDEFYDFEILTSSNSRYIEISRVVDEYVPGLVMVDNNQIMNVDFDSFCYKTKNEEEYTIYNDYSGSNIPTSWVKDEIDESLFRNCPCVPGKKRSKKQENSCWVEEKFSYGDDEDEDGNKITWYRYVDGGDSGTGFSVYTAYYLSDLPGYNDDQIIRFFYPSKWEYKTVIKENSKDNNILENSVQCSYIDFFKTNLTRDEFISLVESYLLKRTSKTAKLFRENAGRIYDLGNEIGANPEMVYIIAEKEQGWKDTDFTLRCNNYYGMGVTNGTSTGKCYNSFEDGVIDILNYVKRKGNLSSFTKVYSYLGTYLANPGSEGDGGCYYLTLNDIYGKNYSRCNSSYQCKSSKGGPGCVKTTETEKQAYIDWQSKKILTYRKNIFHLDSENCTSIYGTNVALGEAGSVNSSDRMKWLFPNGIPKSKEQINAYLTTIQVPVVNVSGTKSTISLTVHSKLANEIKAIFEEMVNIGFPIASAGGYNYRVMASGTGSLSHHSYGVAIDINASANPAIYQSTNINRDSPYYINSRVVSIWKNHGFYWGGDWSSKYYDPMHFTYTNH